MKFKAKYLFFAIPLILIGACKYMLHGMQRVEEGSDVQSASWIPPEASHISFYRTWITDEAKFRISEPGFIIFLESKGLKPEEIKEEKTITLYFIDRELRARAKTDQDYEMLYHKIKNGLFYEKLHPNGGGWTCAYDRDSGFAYYHWAHH
jgi:hypothetical protein